MKSWDALGWKQKGALGRRLVLESCFYVRVS